MRCTGEVGNLDLAGPNGLKRKRPRDSTLPHNFRSVQASRVALAYAIRYGKQNAELRVIRLAISVSLFPIKIPLEIPTLKSGLAMRSIGRASIA